MREERIREYVETYFRLKKCDIIQQDQRSITVRINPETDKELGLRPFYWSYIESVGMEPRLLEVTYHFQPAADITWNSEILLFGSPRLQAIFEAVKKNGKYIQLYEEIRPSSIPSALDPWLIVNYKIEYLSDLKKEKIASLGIHLMTGALKESAFTHLIGRRFSPSPPPFSILRPPSITISEAINRLEKTIIERLMAESDEWAREAVRRLEEEMKEMEAYYARLPSSAEIMEEKERRLKELRWQYEPHIEVRPMNQGIFYLHPSFT